MIDGDLSRTRRQLKNPAREPQTRLLINVVQVGGVDAEFNRYRRAHPVNFGYLRKHHIQSAGGSHVGKNFSFDSFQTFAVGEDVQTYLISEGFV